MKEVHGLGGENCTEVKSIWTPFHCGQQFVNQTDSTS